MGEVNDIERKYYVKLLCKPGPMEKLSSHTQSGTAIRAPPLPSASVKKEAKRQWRLQLPALAKKPGTCDGPGAYPCAEGCAFVTIEHEVQCGVQLWGCYDCSIVDPNCPACSAPKRPKITECEGVVDYQCA